MKQIYLLLICSFMLSLLVVSYGHSLNQKLPVIDGKEVVAMVNNEPITAEDYSDALTSIVHGEIKEKPGMIDYAGIMNRMITERLLLLEAQNIGLDELPEIKKMIDDHSKSTLMKSLVKKQMVNIKSNKDWVDERLKEAVREFKITSVVFENEKDAQAMEEALMSGEEFDDLAKKAIEDGSAKERIEGQYLKNKDLLPEVSAIVSGMEVGSLSTVIAFKQGFALLRLNDIRHPENPQLKERIDRASVNIEKEIAFEKFTELLVGKYAKIDEKLLDIIDYNTSMEEFKKLLKDSRVIAAIKNEEPVTVGVLTDALEQSAYHGVEDSIRKKELNRKKREILTEILQKRVLHIEALKQGLDKTDAYKKKMMKYKRGTVLGAFIQKVVVPDIKYTAKDLEDYFQKNVENYSSPEMLRIEGLVFAERDNAENAIAKLKRGTDMKWLKANAVGLVDKDTAGVLDYNGVIINPHDLPKEAHDALSGAVANDYKLYESSEGHFYVLHVQNVYPSKPGVFEKVKKEIAEKVYNDKITEVVEDWTNQLKEHYKVEIYLKEF